MSWPIRPEPLSPMEPRSLQSPPGAESLLAVRITGFAHLLRAAGIAVGSDQVLDAITAVHGSAITRPADLFTCLFAFFINRGEDRLLFRQAFDLYWQQTDSGGLTLADLVADKADAGRLRQRLAELLSLPAESAEFRKSELQASFSASPVERLQDKDFADMSQDELVQARKMLARMRLWHPERKTRRYRPAVSGERLDRRASFRAALRKSQDMPLCYGKRRTGHSPLVLLCDISGSMEPYSRMLLHFMHALSNDRGNCASRSKNRVFSFVFATGLTPISRQLRHRDVDVAVKQAAKRVSDWSGGTRIGRSLKQFNQLWSRRVLAQGATVILISDGLDTEVGDELGRQMERLNKSCQRLIWLNPLLRYSGFEPKAEGIRRMLPFVDEFIAAHNVNSLVELGRILAGEAMENAA